MDDVGYSPVAVLVIIAIYVGFYAVVSSEAEEDVETYGLHQAPEAPDPDKGVFSAIADVLGTVGSVIGFIYGAITFNVDGAPFWLRIPIAVAVISSLTWSISTLIRGN